MSGVAMNIHFSSFYHRGRRGPFERSNGDLVAIGQNGSTSYLAPDISTDGGATWNLGTDGAQNIGTQYWCDCAFDKANDVIYVLAMGVSYVCEIWKYDCAADSWSQVDGGSGPTVNLFSTSDYPAFLCLLSDGSFVVFYQGPQNHIMGSYYDACYYITCSSGGVWGTATEADAGGQFLYDAKWAEYDGTYVHFIYNNSDSTNFGLGSRSLDSSNTLGTFQIAAGSNHAYNYVEAHWDANLGKIVIYDNLGGCHRASSAANPAWATDTNACADGTYDATFSYDNSGGKLYSIFMHVNVPNQIGYRATGTTTWPTAITLLESGTDVGSSVNDLMCQPVTGGIGVMWNFYPTVYYILLSLSGTKDIVASGISAYSTMGGSVAAQKVITPDTGVAANSTVAGSIGVVRPIAPDTGIAATSSVAGSITKSVPPKEITPDTGIAATSSMSGSVGRTRLLIAAGISAYSTVAGGIVKLAAIAGAISAYSTVAGNVAALKVISGAVSAYSTVVGTIERLAGILPGNISATSSLTGEVSRLRPILPTGITANSTVSGAVGLVKLLIPAGISATSALAGSLSKRAAIAGAVLATSTVSGVLTAWRAVGGAISATSTVTGIVGAIRPLGTGAISANSTVSGNISTTGAITGAITALSSVSGSLRALRAISGNIAANSTVAGALLILRPIIPSGVGATSTVNGSIFAGGVGAIVPSPISATSTVSGSVIHFAIISGNVSASSAVSGSLPILRKISGDISATSTAAGSVHLLLPISGQITAPAAVTGSVTKRAAVTGNIAATATVVGNFYAPGVYPIIGNVYATSTVSGSFREGEIIWGRTPARLTSAKWTTPEIVSTEYDTPNLERVLMT